MLTCKECGAKAKLVDNKIVRDCSHTEAPVIAAMAAKVYGTSKLK